MDAAGRRVTELRLVVTVDDYDEALRFYRDVLGLDEQATYESGGGRLTVLEAGRATLEIAEKRYAEYIDEVEVGRRVAGRFRVAFEVADPRLTTNELTQAGAELVAPPIATPWNSLNARLEGPGPVHLTVYGPVPEP
jgi:lactoylglutathione lyase